MNDTFWLALSHNHFFFFFFFEEDPLTIWYVSFCLLNLCNNFLGQILLVLWWCILCYILNKQYIFFFDIIKK